MDDIRTNKAFNEKRQYCEYGLHEPYCLVFHIINHSFSTNELKAMEAKANDKSLFKSIFTMHDEYMIPRIYQQITIQKCLMMKKMHWFL